MRIIEAQPMTAMGKVKKRELNGLVHCRSFAGAVDSFYIGKRNVIS